MLIYFSSLGIRKEVKERNQGGDAANVDTDNSTVCVNDKIN